MQPLTKEDKVTNKRNQGAEAAVSFGSPDDSEIANAADGTSA